MISSDSKTNTFTDEGRILQVEFAIKNVSKAPTMIGYTCKDGILLLGLKTAPSSKNEKIYKISPNIYCTIAGIFADALQLVGYARVESENFRESFEDEIPVRALAKEVGSLKQSFTIGGGLRPFGVSLLYAGIEDDYVLYSSDPSGSVIKWRGVCFGEMEDQINNALKDLRNDLNLQEATVEVLKILSKVKEMNEGKAELMEVMHFTKERKKILSCEEIKELLIKN